MGRRRYYHDAASHIQAHFHGRNARAAVAEGLATYWAQSASRIQAALHGHQARQVWHYTLEEEWTMASVRVQANFPPNLQLPSVPSN